MNPCLKSIKSNCKNCYKCIRNCPVKSIRFDDDQATIIQDECVLCGSCFLVCPQGVKIIRNDVIKAQEFIASGKPVYVSLAPSFVANYKGATIETMNVALKKLGFTAVEETAIGATIVKNAYDELVDGGNQDIIISTCCHSVNLLVQKHYPEAIKYLAQVQSPMIAHCAKIKKEHPDAYTVFIGPCIAKKDEADRYPEYVDCVLTYLELTEWLEQADIKIERKLFSSEEKGKARLFPTTGGILKTMRCDNPEYTYMMVDGETNCAHAIEDILAGKVHHCFIEMSSCVGSCVNGPMMDKTERNPVEDFYRVSKYAGVKDFDVEKISYNKLLKPMENLKKEVLIPSEEEIQYIFKKLGKKSIDDELNCGSCGYDTCREKAIAVCQGKANMFMCLPYLKEKSESFSNSIIKNTPNGIVVLNENLEIQLMNKSICRMLKIDHHVSRVGEKIDNYIDPFIFANALVSDSDAKTKKMVLGNTGRFVEVTIMHDNKYRIIIALLRDITQEEEARKTKEVMSQQTIEVADRVIEKQMRVVQEIASLLGETTAETKVALTKLKETLKNE